MQTGEDTPKKSQDRILSEEIEAGRTEIERDSATTIISAFLGGLEVGLGVLAIGVVHSLAESSSPLTKRVALALAYSLGFVFVILGRSELFTEHTTLAVMPVLAKQASLKGLFLEWALVLGGNLVGAMGIAALLAWLGPGLGEISPATFGALAHATIDHPIGVMFGSAVLAGWLLGLASWLVTASRDTTAQILMVILVTGTIGIARLHHSILGSIEILTAIFAGTGITVGDYLRFLAVAVLGNAAGGVVFVALLKFGHAHRRHGG